LPLKIFLTCTEPEYSAQEVTSCPYPEPHESNPHSHILFVEDSYQQYFPIYV